MAEIRRRVWRTASGAKRTSYGFTYQSQKTGRQVRKMSAEWDENAARAALVEAMREDAEPGDTTTAAPVAIVDPAPTSSPIPSGMTLDQARERFLATKRAEHKKTVRDDEYHLARLVKALGADLPLADVTAARIAAYRTTRAQQPSQRRPGETISAAAVNHELRALRHLLRLAEIEWEVLDRAPRIRLLREPQGRLRWLEPDEERRLLDVCRLHGGDALHDLALVGMESGLRQGELMSLAWERCDLSRGVIRLELTKSGRRREVPMRQAVYDLLTAKKEPRTGRLWLGRFPRKAWETAVREAKLDGLHFHDLRHHFASWFMMRGGSLPALREILGHRDISMTLRYAHLAPSHLRVEIERTAGVDAKTPAHAQHTMVESSPRSRVSPRKAGVAQRQSN